MCPFSIIVSYRSGELGELIKLVLINCEAELRWGGGGKRFSFTPNSSVLLRAWSTSSLTASPTLAFKNPSRLYFFPAPEVAALCFTIKVWLKSAVSSYSALSPCGFLLSLGENVSWLFICVRRVCACA